ncbi:MAG: protein kinase [Synechococcales cyanobacterium K44_A2020_017]|nr:protein kinase [Synechococcales cyanobacterium K32_A2020_035]MBF2094258.1 protein kinase [Synechococcales cyanobacterium K44_A2020_017]
MTLTKDADLQQGKYVIRHVLEEGDRGITYLAAHSVLQETVRLRTLIPPQDSDPSQEVMHRRFLELGRRLYGCHHPHLVRVIDSFIEQDQPFLVLEHPEGATLAEAIAHQPLSQADALRYIHQIGSALATLHRHGLPHGAVSLQTIVLRPTTPPTALLGSISLGSIQNEEGTERYPSPAQDLQDLARVLYAALTGQERSLDALDMVPLLHNLHQHQPHLSPVVEQALLKALKPDEHSAFSGIEHWLALLPQVVASPQASASSKVASPAADTDKETETDAATTDTPPAHTLSTAPTQVVAPAASSTEPSHPEADLTEPTQVIAPDLSQAAAAAPTSQPTSAKSKGRSPHPYNIRWFPITVGLTSVLAALGGLGFGFSLRLEEPDSPRRNGFLLDREQAFPPSDEWPGEGITDTAASDYLFESPTWASPSQEQDVGAYSSPNPVREYIGPGDVEPIYPTEPSYPVEPSYSEAAPDYQDSPPERPKPNAEAIEAPVYSDSPEPGFSPDPVPPSEVKLDDLPSYDPVVVPDPGLDLPSPSPEPSGVVPGPDPAPL